MQESSTCRCGNRVTAACYCSESEIVFLCNACRINHFKIPQKKHSEIDLVKVTHNMNKEQKLEYFCNLQNYAKSKNTIKYLNVSRKRHLAYIQELCQKLADIIKECTDSAINEMDVIKMNLKTQQDLIDKHFSYPDNQTFDVYHDLSINSEQTLEKFDKRCIDLQFSIASSIKVVFDELDSKASSILNGYKKSSTYGEWEYPPTSLRYSKKSSKTSSITSPKAIKTNKTSEKANSKKITTVMSPGDYDDIPNLASTQEFFKGQKLTKAKLRELESTPPKAKLRELEVASPKAKHREPEATSPKAKSSELEATSLKADNSILSPDEEEAKLTPSVEQSELRKGKRIAIMKNHNGFINSLALSKDNSIMVSGSDTSIIVWNLKKCIELAKRELIESVNCIAITSDKTLVIYGSEIGTVNLWDYNKNKIRGVFKGHEDSVNCIAITSNDQLVVTGSRDKTLRIWDLDQMKEIGVLKEHKDIVKTCAISLDNKYLISGSYDHTIIVWYLQTQTVKSVINTQLPVNCLSLTSGSLYIVYGSWDSLLRIYSMKEKRQVAALEGHQNWITTVAISRDGRFIITGSQDKTLKLWSLETKKPIALFKRHAEAVTCTAITFDNRYVISGSNDNSLIVWKFDL